MENLTSQSNPQFMRIGTSDFLSLITGKDPYVDKTYYIKQLLTAESKMVLLTRPRRFGKTLLVSTLEQVLLGRQELFENFQISTAFPKFTFESSHVIRLNFLRTGIIPEDFDSILMSKIQALADNYGIVLNEKHSANAIYKLIEQLYKHYDSFNLPSSRQFQSTRESAIPDIPQVAILIDEYDDPLVKTFKNENKFSNIRDTMFNFFSAIKDAEENNMIRFGLITGITRFTDFLDFFSMANIIDITYLPFYSSICGFSIQEIKTNFITQIDAVCARLKAKKIMSPHLTSDDFLKTLEEWYDGYSWDGDSKVLNPYSVLNCLKFGNFEQFWYKSSRPGFLRQLMSLDDEYFKLFNRDISYESIPAQTVGEISSHAALLQTGYLTIDRIAPADDDKNSVGPIKYFLSIPNKEVRRSFASEYLMPIIYPNISGDTKTGLTKLYKDFSNAFVNRESDKAAELLSIIFDYIPYDLHVKKESYYKTIILQSLCFSKSKVTFERKSAKGATDIVLETINDVLVIEVKYTKPSKTINTSTKQDNTDSINVSVEINNDDRTIIQSIETKTDEKPRQMYSSELVNSMIHGDPFDYPNIPEPDLKIQKKLDGGITRAFKQISTRDYAKGFLGQGKGVWTVAISIVGPIEVQIEYKEVNVENS
jgi:hypothetical protein